jgi:hypothetical protein
MSSNAKREPLNLFQPRDVELEQQTSSYKQPTGTRAQSAKPPPREYSELFAGADEGSPSPSAISSPQKERIQKKGGAGKNFTNRLFENEEPAATPLGVKTNSKKYNHFEFGDNEDNEATPKGHEASRPNKSKHQSQWDFEDFVTPEKTKLKVQPQAVRHFGWSDDEVRPFRNTARICPCAPFCLVEICLRRAREMLHPPVAVL